MAKFFKNAAGDIIRVQDQDLGSVDENRWSPVDPKAAYNALAQREEDKYQSIYGGTMGKVQGTAEAALSSATAGIYPNLLATTEQQQQFERFQKENPELAVGGEIAGAFIPWGAPAKIAKAVALPGAAKTFAGAVARGAAEGGMFNVVSHGVASLAQAANDADIANAPPITLERVASQMAMDFLAGGAVGGAFGAAGYGASKLYQKFFGPVLKNKLAAGLEAEAAAVPGESAGFKAAQGEAPIATPPGGIREAPVIIPPPRRRVPGEGVGDTYVRPPPGGVREEPVLVPPPQRKVPPGEGTVNQRTPPPQPERDFQGTAEIPIPEAPVAPPVSEVPPEIVSPLGEKFREAGDRILWKKIADTAGDVKKFGERKEELMGVLDRAGILGKELTADNFEGVVSKLETYNQKQGQRMGGILQRLEESSPAANEIGQLFSEVEKNVKSKLGLRNAEEWKAAQKELANFSQTMENQQAAGKLTWESVREFRSNLGYDRNAPTELAKARAEISAELRDALIRRAESVLGKDVGQKYKLANNEYERVIKLLGLTRDVASKAHPVSVWEAGKVAGAVGGAVGAAFGGPVGGVGLGGAVAAGAIVGKAASRRLPLIEQQLMYKAAGAMDALGNALRSKLFNTLVSGASGGKYYAAMKTMYAMNDEDMLNAHMHMATGPNGPEYLAAMGQQPSTDPGLLSTFSQQLAEAQHNKDVKSAVEQQIKDSARAFVGGPKTDVAVREPKIMPERLPEVKNAAPPSPREVARRLNNLDIQGVYAKFAPENWSVSPTSGALLARQAVAHLQFLKSKVPYEAAATALRPAIKASAADWAKFGRYVEASTPGQFLELLKKGQVTVEGVEAMEAIAPAALQQLRLELYAQSTRLKALPYAKRVLLARIVGPEALNLTQNQVNLAQQIHAEASATAPQGKPVGDGRQRVDAEENMQTQAQRLEGRGQ